MQLHTVFQCEFALLSVCCMVLPAASAVAWNNVQLARWAAISGWSVFGRTLWIIDAQTRIYPRSLFGIWFHQPEQSASWTTDKLRTFRYLFNAIVLLISSVSANELPVACRWSSPARGHRAQAATALTVQTFCARKWMAADTSFNSATRLVFQCRMRALFLMQCIAYWRVTSLHSAFVRSL